MIFWRVLDDKLYAIDEVDKLGFETEEGLRIPDEYLDNQELRVNNLTRTMTWIDAGTFKSLLLASNLICNLEEIQSYKISCPEEVAYKNGWIDKEELLKLAATYPKGEYQSYLNVLPSL